MKTSAQHSAKLRALLRDLPGLKQRLGQDYGDTATALVKERSIETGIDQNGVAGSKVKYSDKKVPSYLLKGKELNQAGRAYLEKNKTANWYGLRQAQGLRSANVNLTYTGESWKRYGVIQVQVTSGHVTIRVGLSGPQAEVFAHNVERYGKFYQNTPVELARLREGVQLTARKWLTTYRS